MDYENVMKWWSEVIEEKKGAARARRTSFIKSFGRDKLHPGTERVCNFYGGVYHCFVEFHTSHNCHFIKFY